MTSAPRSYRVSPLMFLRPRQHGATAIDVGTGNAFERLTPRGADLVAYAAVRRTHAELLSEGFTEAEIDGACEMGLIMKTEDPTFTAAEKWENAHWSRAAYTLFSQFELTYAEEEWGARSLEDHVTGRREQIQSYIDETPYPEKFWVACDGDEVSLPRPGDEALTLRIDRLLDRRSVRSFKRDPLDLDLFSTILYGATVNVRCAVSSQAEGDPFFILNSFYSWLSIFVVVQNVASLDPGVYQYDGENHRLRPLGHTVTNREIADAIANQNWISGGGFCLFVSVDWQRYMWIYRHARAYINLITQLGEFGQEVIQHASNNGLGGWMTPAVDEKAAAALLRIDVNRVEPMYFMKIGAPAEEPQLPSGP